MALAEVYEVATFYAHFDVVKEGETPPPADHGSRVQFAVLRDGGIGKAARRTERQAREGRARYPRALHGRLRRAPVFAVGHVQTFKADADSVEAAVKRGTHAHAATPGSRFDAYRKEGGYALLKDRASTACARARRSSRSSTIPACAGSAARDSRPAANGRSCARENGPRLMAVNGDEGEPGTFKDRYYLGRDPHRFIEGMLIGAWVVEAPDVYFYLRDEYPEIRLMILEEIAKVEAAGLMRHTRFHFRRGAGAYICGEESAMIESIEGKRGSAAPSSALCRASRPVRPADARTECRDAVLDPRHRRAGRFLVHVVRAP